MPLQLLGATVSSLQGQECSSRLPACLHPPPGRPHASGARAAWRSAGCVRRRARARAARLLRSGPQAEQQQALKGSREPYWPATLPKERRTRDRMHLQLYRPGKGPVAASCCKPLVSEQSRAAQRPQGYREGRFKAKRQHCCKLLHACILYLPCCVAAQTEHKHPIAVKLLGWLIFALHLPITWSYGSHCNEA